MVLVYTHELISAESERKPLRKKKNDCFDWLVNSCVNMWLYKTVDAQKLDLYSIFKHEKLQF